MALSRTIQELLLRAAETSTINDDALDELGRRVLEAVILDPETPEHLKAAAARLLSGNHDAPSSPGAIGPDGTPD